MRYIIFLLMGLVIGAAFLLPKEGTSLSSPVSLSAITSSPSPTPKFSLVSPPPQKILENSYHVFQTFNNCGPAALSMALSYYGVRESQQKLGEDLRPYQNPQGDNDDKSVTLAELAEKSKEYGLIPYHRPNGDREKIKLFITYDIPVVTRTWLKTDEDIGHYRIVKGYDDTKREIIQDDSLQGSNLRYSYDEFHNLWKKFNYEYLVLVPEEKQQIAEAILKEDKDNKIAWKKAEENARRELDQNPDDVYARFNLSVALYNIGDFQQSVEEFEKVENKLPFRTLWYQIEPVQAYFALGNAEKVLTITDRILNNHNRAFSELYLLRGEIYKKQGNYNAARSEFEKALLYNKNMKKAQDALRP